MQTREIDQRLQEYTAAEHRISANLVDLESHSVYQLLTTDDLTGETARLLNPSLRADPGLWDLLMLLESTLSRARTIRGSGRLSRDERDQLSELLNGPSLLISSTKNSLATRGLTDAAVHEERLTIGQAIARMRSIYEPLRDGVARADHVLRTVLPQLDAAERNLDRIVDEIDALGLRTLNPAAARRRLSDLRERCLSDPISVTDATVSQLWSETTALSEAVDGARAGHDRLGQDLARAENLLNTARSLLADAEAHRQASHQLIAHPVGLRAVPSPQIIDGPKGLAATLRPILGARGDWQPTRAALDAWLARAERLNEQLQRVAAANHTPLDQRDELRGRLAAFRAKKAGRRIIDDHSLDELVDEIHSELHTAPTDLGRAQRLLDELGRLL